MPLPTFVIVGERRSGTTSLSHLMAAHPDIYVHDKREIGYFIEDEAKGTRRQNPETPLTADTEAWARTHTADDYAAKFAAGADYPVIGEKSADYLFWSPAHARLAAFLPDARFIVSLREPVSRAWSHYWNEVGKGRERLTFAEALEAEGERCRISAYARNHLSYGSRGFYDESLARFLSCIPQDRVLVITLDEMGRDRDGTLAKVLRFVGADPSRMAPDIETVRNANWTMVPKPWAERPGLRPIAQAYDRAARITSKLVTKDKFERRRVLHRLQSVFREPVRSLEMPDAVRKRLKDLYRPHIDTLEQLLGRRFDEWR